MLILSATLANAQYTADFQTNIISGVTSNCSVYMVGSNTSYDALLIENAGVLNAYNGYVGATASSSNNNVLITDPGSAWTCAYLSVGGAGSGNSLVISNGASLVGAEGPGITTSLGATSNSCNNRIVVTGTGSVWSAWYDGHVYIGYYGSSNTVQVEDGGKLVAGYYDLPFVGYMASSCNNRLVVTGSNTVNGSGAYVGYHGSGNTMIISNGAQVAGGGIGCGSDSSNNSVIVTGPGSIWNDGSLDLGRAGNGTGSYNRSNSVVITDGGLVNITGGLAIEASNAVTIANNGSLIVSGSLTFNVINPSLGIGQLNLNGGLLSCGGLSFNGFLNPPQPPFRIGNGADLAIYHMAGGYHSYQFGFEVRSNGFLTGCGVIYANPYLVIDPGGTLLADCGGTLELLSGTVTNNGVMRVTNGSKLISGATFINNGLIDIMSGATNFHNTFINNGTVVDALYFNVVNVTPQSNDVNISWTTVGGRSYVVQAATVNATGYSTNFMDASPVFAIPGASLGTTNYIDAGALTNTPSRFYRVRLVP